MFGQYNSLVKISGGSDSYILAYGGPDTGGGTAYDGFIKTFSIPLDGSTIRKRMCWNTPLLKGSTIP